MTEVHDEGNAPASELTADVDPGCDPEGDGVDVSLVRWLLSSTVAERLAVLQAQASSLAKMRDAVAER